jgi:pimeloyl-ACP methyl ester carboxylesterase
MNRRGLAVGETPETYRPRRPALALTIAEAAAFAQRGHVSSAALKELAATVPRGDGHAVLVLPPIFRDDATMDAMRRFLALLGYLPHGWELGANLGPTRALTEGAAARLTDIAARHGKVSLVGVSMGGLFARWLAARTPEFVRQVITAGSPFRASADSTFVPLGNLIEVWRGPDIHAMAAEIEQTPTVPTTSIYSRQDGIVAWASCYDPACPEDAIEVTCPHVLMPQHPDVLRAVAGRLTRPEDTPRWK